MENRCEVWSECEVIRSTVCRCGVKEMLCAAQVWTEGEIMWSTGGRCAMKERLCGAQEAGVK